MAATLAKILQAIGIPPKEFTWRNMCSRVGSAGSGMPIDSPIQRVVDRASSQVDYCTDQGGCCEGCWAKAFLAAVSAAKNAEQKAI